MSNWRLQGRISVHYLCKTRKECRWNVCDALWRIWHGSCEEILSVSKGKRQLGNSEEVGLPENHRASKKQLT